MTAPKGLKPESSWKPTDYSYDYADVKDLKGDECLFVQECTDGSWAVSCWYREWSGGAALFDTYENAVDFAKKVTDAYPLLGLVISKDTFYKGYG